MRLHTGTFHPTDFRKSPNILVEGLGSREDIKNGTKMRFGTNVVLEVTEQNQPCSTLQSIDKRVLKLIIGKRGLLAKVIDTGIIKKGDKVKFTVRFKGREMQHTELGKELMNKIIEETKDIAKVETGENDRPISLQKVKIVDCGSGDGNVKEFRSCPTATF